MHDLPETDNLAHQPREQAIPALIDAYGPMLYSLGRRICGNTDEAQDLVQETFLQAWRKWDQFEGRSNPKTWLYTIAGRLCQRMHRRRAGQPEHMIPIEAVHPFHETSAPTIVGEEAASALDEQTRREAIERLEYEVAHLPENYRLPIVLKEILELPVAEVARILDMSEATVKTRLHRGRLALRKAVLAGLPMDEAPEPQYEKQVCLDLLHAKQEALDHDQPFPLDDVLCERCRNVFGSLDLARELCLDLREGILPDEIREQVLARVEHQKAHAEQSG